MPRIKEEAVHEIIIEKSRFITYLNRSMNEEESKAYITQIRKMHPTANHHCTAFICGEFSEYQRSSDDGEPSGTAGVPMLEVLRKNQMQDITAVTVRYFGGIKLGAGGLVRAYSKSVAQALECARMMEVKDMTAYSAAFSYDLIGAIDYYFMKQNIAVIEKNYDELVHYTYLSDFDASDKLSELSKGRLIHTKLYDTRVEAEITSIPNNT